MDPWLDEAGIGRLTGPVESQEMRQERITMSDENATTSNEESTKTGGRSKRPSIDRAQAMAVLDEVQGAHPDRLAVEEKAGWTKVTSTASGLKVYIQNRPDVREVHLSGFGAGLPGTVMPPKKNGKVEAWLDIEAADPYEGLRSVLTTLATSEAKAKPAPAPKSPSTPKAKPAGSADADRVARIAKRAAELGLGTAATEEPEVIAPAADDASSEETAEASA